MIEAGVVCPIWKSPEITSGPFTARKNLPSEMKEEIATMLMEIPDKDPEAFASHDRQPQAGRLDPRQPRALSVDRRDARRDPQDPPQPR